ncbi:Voltage-dependent T-type calcium channel subunit alpha-1I [Nibea albiflora]|uniref:Voltage-dependent T-type calcium channel subunit alpha-1I n=1 Tax=Nibea albiflora TaxID=240163 RepID=A0ACB7FGV0_NIBAL|nr:Voltage-dependent T-type calcium channel subunit alpha-1I [Nibea albiflora]
MDSKVRSQFTNAKGFPPLYLCFHPSPSPYFVSSSTSLPPSFILLPVDSALAAGAPQQADFCEKALTVHNVHSRKWQMGSFVMMNVCAVVIVNQFAESRQRDKGQRPAGATSIAWLCDMLASCLRDTLRPCRPGDNGCLSYLHWVSPIFFTSFVVMGQFVLVNLVVAAIVQALEDSNEVEAGQSLDSNGLNENENDPHTWYRKDHRRARKISVKHRTIHPK